MVSSAQSTRCNATVPVTFSVTLRAGMMTMMMTIMMMMMMQVTDKAADKRQLRLRNGLVTRHAYSVTGLARGRGQLGDTHLVRLRNPWGRGEVNTTY